MKAALKRLFNKEHAVVSQVPSPRGRQSSASLGQSGCSTSVVLSCPPPGEGKNSESFGAVSDVSQDEQPDCSLVHNHHSTAEIYTKTVLQSSWNGALRKSQTQVPDPNSTGEHGPTGATPDKRSSWNASSAPRAPRRSMDVALAVPLEALPAVGHLAEADWTRALTGNIKSVANVHGALSQATGSTSPNSPYVSQLSRRPSVVSSRRRQSSAMGYGPHFEAGLLQTSQCCAPVPQQLRVNHVNMTASLDDVVDDCLDSGLRYLADGDTEEQEPEPGEALPDVLPPALLEEAARAGISLQVDLDSEVTLSSDPPLGRGSSGTVLKAVYKGQPCAVKMLPPDLLFGSDGTELHTFVQEVVVMAPLRHPNIVTFLGGSLQPPHVFLLAELCGTSLDSWLHRGPVPPTSLQVLQVALDVATGMQYLHGRQPPIVHRDLKPANVLIDANGTAKISDFGLARVKTNAAINTKAPLVGSVGYMAPECFTSENGLLTDKCDTWSLGVLLWELVARKRPFAGLSLTEYFREVVVRKARPPIPQDDGVCPLAMRRLISSCWCDDPEERPSCAHIVAELTRMLKYCPRD